MGLFGWIKKDLSVHRRRESAPPLTQNITSASSSGVASSLRDESYLEKLNKFNEFRNQQRLERIAEGVALEPTTSPGRQGRIPSVIEEESDGLTGGTLSDISSDVEVSCEERKALLKKFEAPKSPRYTRHRSDGVAPRKPKRSVEFYRNINRIPESGEQGLNNGKNSNVSERFSMPTMLPSGIAKRNKTRFSKPNNSIYENEVEEFENQHVRDTLGDTYAVQSPPSRFYKKNSSPYVKPTVPCRVAPAVVDTTPKKQVNLLQKSSRPKSFKDKPAPPPPLPMTEPPKLQNHMNESGSDAQFAGSYKGFDLNASSIYDEHVISSRGYRGNMTTTNATSSSAKERRKSPFYQTIINKHGDLVDYALPFSDTQSEQNSSKNGTLINDIRACEEVINENFDFLNSNVHPTSTVLIDDCTSMINEPISVLKQRAPHIVTDLDRSLQSKNEPTDEVDLVIHEPNDILLELDSLEKWSKSIQLSDDFLQKQFTEKNMLEHFQRASSALLICWPKDVHYRVGSLRSPFLAPLEYSAGLFRNTPVTLRKYSLNVERSLYFAEEGCKKDADLLNQIKHYAIASLMAVCYDPGLNQATLVLEPFDFTLFDYIHKMNKRLSLFHAITVVQQIASAVAYLQECGYIHSNISSGTVLMRRYPYAVKLTSFELATEIADTVRKDIENRYGSTSSSRNSMTSSQNEELKKITTYSRLIKNDEQFMRDKYRKRSKEVSECRRRSARSTLGDNSAYDLQASRYLPYCKEYREKFSLFYYVAPELLVPKANFVFPTVATDVYSLTLLLWEILNGYVPFVVYSRQELEKLHVSAALLQLPMFEKERCDHFRKVFETGLADLSGRKLTVSDILDTVDCLLLEQDSEKQTRLNGFSDDYEERMDNSEVRKKNELNDVRKQSAMEKTDKKYFQSSGDYVNAESIARAKQRPVKPARKINKPKVEKEETKKSSLGSSFNLSNSALYQSIFDFNNKFLSPRSSKPIYERTSTVKKHKKPARAGKKAVKELFEPTAQTDSRSGSFHNLSEDVAKHAVGKTQEVIGPLEVYCKESPAKMNINNEKAKFFKETLLDKDSSAYDRTNEAPQSVTSKSCDSSPGTRRKSVYPSKLSNSMRFTIGDITLPDTPIARKNKIRKHAWLSDQKLGMSEGNTSTPVTPQGRRLCSFFNDLDSRRAGRSQGEFCTPLNMNISSSMQEIKPKKINISVNIIKSSDVGSQLKACSEDFSKTSPAIVDIDIDEPAVGECGTQKAESAGNIFEDTLWKKEKELCERSQHRRSTNDLDEADKSASVITAHLTSVRDTIRKIETTFENTGFDYSPGRKSIGDSAKKVEVEKKISEESVVVEENLLIPTKVLELEKTIEQCTPVEVETKPSVSHLDVVLTNNTQKKKEELLQHQQHPETPLFNPNSQLFIRRKATNGTSSSVIQRTVYRESIVSSTDLPGLDKLNSPTQAQPGSARKTKLTTRVTVNMRKISRRASDIGTSPAPSRPSSFIVEDEFAQPPSGCVTPTNGPTAAPFRHSCGNDLLKAIAAVRSSSVNESRPTSSVAGDRRSMCTPVKSGPRGDRFVCCNCGSSMVPADSLNVPSGSRIGMSAAFSELNFPRESLPSMFDENLGFIHIPGTPSSRQTLMPPNARSTEDLYIDDDFGPGQLQLGANMELLVDDAHYLDEFDYDVYTEETIYDTEEDDVKVGELQGPDEEQLFVSKCADLNPTSVDGAVFATMRPTVDGDERK
ncbi:uncharacterized protein LOC120428213 [Culex pipiens pallens]|uniref:uncharacterized protein LOC120428213 n=1 Tax=Culex pipiens pallens TaxID=42434 RepID=UPI001952DB1C|nr:uncharacterized protein LOC120428213 [Culex pipiens pallens]